MVLKVNTAEGGSNGTEVTAANIATITAGGSGDAFSFDRSGGTAFFSSTYKHRGNLSYRLVHVASQSQSLRWGGWGTAKSVSTRSYHYFPTMPTGQIHGLVTIWPSSFSGSVALSIDAENRAVLQNAAYANLYHPAAATFTFQSNTWYRVELAAEIGATTTTGTVRLSVYVGDATTPAITYATTTANTGPAADTINSVLFGRQNKPTGAYDQYLDNLAAADGTTSELGPVAADTATEPPPAEATSVRKVNGADDGTVGASITDASVGSLTGGLNGDPFTLVRSGGAATFVSSPSHRGSRAYRLSYAAGEDLSLRWGGWGTTKQISTRSYHHIPTFAAANHGVIGVWTSSYSGGITAYIDAERRLLVQDAAANTVYHPAASTFTFAAGTWYRIELAVAIGTTTTSGTIRVAVFPGESTTAAVSQLITTANTGPAADTIAEVTFGRNNKAAVAFDHHLDNLAAVSGTTASLGHVGSSPVVTASGGRTGIEPGDTVTLTGGNPATGVLTRSWRQVSGSPTVAITGASSATATFTAPATLAGTTLVFGYRVMNTDGLTSTEATVSHTVLPAAERAVMGGAEVPVLFRAAMNGGLL